MLLGGADSRWRAGQVVNGNGNTVKAQQGVDILAGQTAGHGNGYVGSNNGNNNENNQQYVAGNGNVVVGTAYTDNNGVRALVRASAALHSEVTCSPAKPLTC